MKKLFAGIQVFVFLFYIASFFLLFAALPDRDFSEQENRCLQKIPSFSFRALFKGEFTRDFENYISDQFPFRDKWIGLKSRLELALGKTENNGVFICGDDTLIARFEEPDMTLVDDNIDAVRRLSENTEAAVYLALVPTAAAIWSHKLPDYAASCDEKALIGYIYSKLGSSGVTTVDMYSELEKHRDEYIYYRTDHHWTTLGAYYGYAALAEALGLGAEPLSAFEPVTVTEDFYGTAYSSSGVRWVKPDSIAVYVPAEGVSVTNYPKGEAVGGSVYDYSFLDGKNKYALFFGGNSPRLVAKTGRGGGKLLLLRDSYADAMVPFLFDGFAELHMLDLRYYKSSVSEYIGKNGIDAVVVCYGLKNFAGDASVFLAGH